MQISVSKEVESYIKHRRQGEAITREQILCKVTGSVDALDKAISRATKAKLIEKLAPGLYARPKQSRFGTLPPSQTSVLKALETKYSAVIVPSGAKAANAIGLSTQLPMRQVYISNKRISPIKVGSQTITFQYSKALPEKVNRHVALIFSALNYLGKSEAESHHKRLSVIFSELSPRQRNQLSTLAKGKFSWMQRILKDENNEELSRAS